MKILENSKDLVGKTNKFVHATQFAEHITIATEDGYVVVLTKRPLKEDSESNEIAVLTEQEAISYIENNSYLRKELGKLDIFDIDAYNQKVVKHLEQVKREEERRKTNEEFKLYERLKARFEPNNS